MRDRLIELTKRAQNEWLEKEYEHEIHKDLAEYVADYLLANGVIVPPCKLGQTVYCIFEDNFGEPYISESFVTAIVYRDIGLIIRCRFCFYKPNDIGKCLFFSREEAEKALAERSENEHRTDN